MVVPVVTTVRSTRKNICWSSTRLARSFHAIGSLEMPAELAVPEPSIQP